MATKKTQPILKPMKQVKEDGVKSALKFAIRGGSAIAAGAGSNMARNIMPKVHGPAAMMVGLLGEVFIDNDELRAVTEGIGVWGSIHTAKTFIPETSSMRTTLGLGSTDGSTEKTIEIDSTPDWAALAEEVNFEEVYDAPSDEEMDEAMNVYNDLSEEVKGVEITL